MTVLREAVILPGLLLTVALLGGLRVGSVIRFVPPPLIALVLGLLTIAALVRAGALQPADFMDGRRRPLENVCGAVLLVALAAASVQVFNLLIPDRGLLHAVFGTFFFVQLLSTLAGTSDRRLLLRSLAVLFGSAFVLRYVVLESLYAGSGSTLARLVTMLMEGVSLGALQYEAGPPSAGYLAFAAVSLYLVALFLLHTPKSHSVALTPRRPEASQSIQALILLVLVGCVACGKAESPKQQSGSQPGSSKGLLPAALRGQALEAARVWQAPPAAIGSAGLARNPPGPQGFADDNEVTCRFSTRRVGGTTPKFYCTLPSGEVVKVKYGAGNAELHAEVAATRLLATLGFSADQMFVVKRVRCFGCPVMPFQSLRCIARTGLERACVPGTIDYDRAREFQPAVIERRIAGRVLESKSDEGWAWFELDRIDPQAGGSPRRDVDALRLMAVLLAHWDNKPENQRLVCPPGADLPDGGCAAPLAVIQDLGATFGPTKLDLRNWRATPIWQDPGSCRVSMEGLPHGGATFPEAAVSEEGRLHLLHLLEQLSEAQIRDLFTGSGAITFDAVNGEGRSASAWAGAFLDKVRQIREAGPCPSAATLEAAVAR
jgi:hypothetical protein